jgi:hypothetical protein
MTSRYSLTLDNYTAKLFITPTVQKDNTIGCTVTLAKNDGSHSVTNDRCVKITNSDSTYNKLSYTKKIFLEGYKLVLTVDTRPINNKVQWALTLSDSTFANTVTTSGDETLKYIYPPPKPVESAAALSPCSSTLTAVTPNVTGSDNIVIAPATTLSESSVNEVMQYVEDRLKEVTISAVEVNKHTAHIKKLLADVTKTKGKENKTLIVNEILTYLAGPALNLTKIYPNFKKTVIDKCYELKTLHPDLPELIHKVNTLLTALDVSTDVPTATTTTSFVVPKREEKPVEEKPVEEKPVEEKPLEKESNLDDLEKALFLSIAKARNFKRVLADSENYFKYYKQTLRFSRIYLDCKTPADRINKYFRRTIGDDYADRIHLMKELFVKNKLVFNDLVMDFYNDWVKTFKYKGKGNVNRYIKMNEFVTVHKPLFTTA